MPTLTEGTMHNLLSSLLFLGIAVPAITAEAHNHWMKSPSKPSEASSLPQTLRHDRDVFFDAAIGSESPLTPENANHSHISEQATFGDPPEIQRLAVNSAVIIGTFEGHQSVLSASRRSVYTEIRLQVSEVVGDHGANIARLSDITVAVPGGTIELGDGSILSYLTDDTHYSLQPDHTYLFVVTHQVSGDFYLVDKSWDITSGSAEPNTPLEEDRARRHASRLKGMSVEAAIKEVQRELTSCEK